MARRWAAILSTVLAGCAAPDGPPGATTTGPGGDPTAVVVGLTADFVPGPDMGRLVAQVRVDGEERSTTTWLVDGPEPLAFPRELWIDDLDDGARVDVTLLAYEGTGEAEEPFLTRAAATSSLAGSALLLRAHLEWECVPSFQLPGELIAPECKSPDTCIAAACEDPYVPPSALEPYVESWAVDYTDECRPDAAGEPEVTIGQGFDAYQPMQAGDSIGIEAGTQGGFHVWVALRARDLHREGSTTTVQIHRDDTGAELCFVKVPWDFHPSEDGACDLFGIQCIVSYDLMDVMTLSGQEATISAKVVDLLGNVAFGQQAVILGSSKAR